MLRKRNYKPKNRKSYRTNRDPDMILLVISAFLTLFGWVMVYSSSVIVTFSQDKSSWYYFLRQLFWIIAGSIGGYILYKIDYKKYPKIAPFLISAAIILLILVLIIGVDINGSKRWIRFPLFDFQPSEFAKLAFIIYLSSWLSRAKKAIKHKSKWKNYLMVDMIPFLAILFLILTLVLLEPDLGTTGIIGIVALGMFYLSGEGALHNFGFFSIMITGGLVGVLAAVLESYRLSRIQTYLTVLKTGMPDDRLGSGYQLSQVLIAVGSGGFLGAGFGQSKQKFNYLGETAFSDTIFAVIAEELGFLGASLVVSAFLYFGIRGFKIALNAPDRLSALLASGITIWITLQAFLNIAANIGLIPLTGIPMPFVSYGGSSMIVTLCGLGILLNISKYVNLD